MPEREPPQHLDADSMTYEQAINALETIIEQIEDGTIGLEESIDAYKRGTGLIRRCRTILQRAEQEIQTLDAALGEAAGADEGSEG